MGLVITSKKTSAVKKLAVGMVPAGALMLGLFFSGAVSADTSTVVVTEASSQGWAQNDTRPGGSTSFVEDTTAPLGSGALQLETDNTNAAKADFFHEANVPLSEATDIAYSTKKLAANSPATTASFQLAIDINGGALEAGDFTTLVYEPYWQNNLSPDAAPVVANEWQSWDVDQGYFWSSRTVGSLTAGAGGPPFYTLADVLEAHPNAQLLAYGVNIGSTNPGTTVNVDQVVFNGVTYDFEVMAAHPTTKDECKNGGWMNFTADYKNQGQCIASVQSSQNSRHNR